MAKKQKEIPGGVVKVKFDDNLHTYGRILKYGDLAFYDCKTETDIDNLNEIIRSPIIFKGMVNVEGVQYGRWPIVGVLPLEDELQSTKYYTGEIGKPDLCIIIENGIFSFNVPKEQAIGLDIGIFWSPETVEERIRDYYTGKENITLKLYDVLGNYKFKK
jgi:hypothetical protein